MPSCAKQIPVPYSVCNFTPAWLLLLIPLSAWKLLPTSAGTNTKLKGQLLCRVLLPSVSLQHNESGPCMVHRALPSSSDSQGVPPASTMVSLLTSLFLTERYMKPSPSSTSGKGFTQWIHGRMRAISQLSFLGITTVCSRENIHF